jgi:uncharacterized phage protein (TIGR01671 family)
LREIKFRAWDNVVEKIYYTGEEDNIHFYFDSSGIIAESFKDIKNSTPEGDIFDDVHVEKLEHLIYMQYTGLKDKNGKEIYEGDIVENRYENPLAGGEVIERYKIETAESSLIKMMHSSGLERYDRYLWMNYKTITVVGNIYEYPDFRERASL